MDNQTNYNSKICFCSNTDCINISLGQYVLDEKKCPICSNQLSEIGVDENYGMNRSLSDLELQYYAQEIFDDDNYKNSFETKLPTPIAWEYKRLKDIMLDGNIEGACWKIANLAEIVVSYLYAATIVKRNKDIDSGDPQFSNNTFKSKCEYITHDKCKDIYTVTDFEILQSLVKVFSNIMNWRNSSGVGHGSLSENRIDYILKLNEYAVDIVNSLPGFLVFLEKNDLSLSYNDQICLCGYDKLIKINNNDKQLGCNFGRSSLLNCINPALIFAYDFDCPDVYFFSYTYTKKANLKNKYLVYRNFRYNRIKTIEINKKSDHGFDVSWDGDYIQVSLRNPTEASSLIAALPNLQKNNDVENLNEFLISSAEKLYKHGMYKESLEFLDQLIFYKTNAKRYQLEYKNKLLRSYINFKKGDISEFADFENSIQVLRQKAEFPDNELVQLKYYVEKIWLIASIKDKKILPSRINTVNSLYNKIEKQVSLARGDKIELPFSNYLLRIEAKKNYLYFMHYVIDDPSCDKIKMQSECKKLINQASAIYAENFDNKMVVDIIGFGCNLYCDFTESILDSTAQNDDKKYLIDEMETLILFGKKIRKRAYSKWMDDVWTVRGYAWSLHRYGRFIEKYKNDFSSAVLLYGEANRLRSKYKDYGNADIELKDDSDRCIIDIERCKNAQGMIL